MSWYLDALKNYSAFEGRSGRGEFCCFILFNIIICCALYFTNEGLWILYALAVLLPSIAVSVRRLHDIDRSGWWVLIAIVPVVDIALLFLMLQDSKPGVNQYGFNPKDVIA
jgi:uncharacterized membrane protein YhaH (DUF805 family)